MTRALSRGQGGQVPEMASKVGAGAQLQRTPLFHFLSLQKKQHTFGTKW